MITHPTHPTPSRLPAYHQSLFVLYHCLSVCVCMSVYASLSHLHTHLLPPQPLTQGPYLTSFAHYVLPRSIYPMDGMPPSPPPILVCLRGVHGRKPGCPLPYTSLWGVLCVCACSFRVCREVWTDRDGLDCMRECAVYAIRATHEGGWRWSIAFRWKSIRHLRVCVSLSVSVRCLIDMATPTTNSPCTHTQAHVTRREKEEDCTHTWHGHTHAQRDERTAASHSRSGVGFCSFVVGGGRVVIRSVGGPLLALKNIPVALCRRPTPGHTHTCTQSCTALLQFNCPPRFVQKYTTKRTRTPH
mmetsp:Transcript_8528/g.24354  ORF Transcript_8528/g.24354 Transcript_8528/m.24354 type:complete len:300 (+) Transcript_8528:2284-3183(+)